jgi:hypothetical protein
VNERIETMTHLNDDELQIWADGEASDGAQAAAWGAHVEQCDACSTKVASVRALGRGMRIWADSVGGDGIDGDLAERILKLAAESEASSAGGESKPATVATVVPMRAPRKRWVWGAMPIAIAAAAALVFAIKQPPRSTHRVHPPTNQVVHQELPTPVEPDLPPDVDPGSEVLAVQTTDDHTTYSVLELQMKESGATTAVVWIDDRSEEGAGAVQ